MYTALRTNALAAPRLTTLRSQWFLFGANALLLVAVLVALYTVSLGNTAMRVGGVAGTTVIAPHQAIYIDRDATRARQQQIRAAVPPVYKRDTSLLALRQRQASSFLTRATSVLAGKGSIVQKATALQNLLPVGVYTGALQQFPNVPPSDLRTVQQRSVGLLEQATDWPFDSNQIPTTEIGLLSTLPAHIPVLQRTAVGEILATFLAPTLVEDLAATKAKRDEAARRVAPVTATIASGQVVVRRGDVITASTMDKLAALGLQTRSSDWHEVLASLLFSIVILTMLVWYLYAFHSDIVANPRLLILVDVSILTAVAAARLLEPGHVLLPLFVPVAAAPTFAAALIAPDACIAIAFAMSFLAGWVVADSFQLAVYYFLSSAAGVLAVRQVRQLKQFVIAGGYIFLFALPTTVAFQILSGNHDLAALQEDVLAAGFNGFVSATLALGGFALLSEYFGVTTLLRLLELGQPGQPLLRQLMVRAPGTYNHSMIVANMVERAAEEIGANALVAKVSALYHDVGKSTNPSCFVENQMGIGNIHDELRPDESVRLIRGHVVHGTRLARQHRLPRIILNAIAEHHGTMTISYFLHRARKEMGQENVDTSLYTYPGPKPQSKETALLMLADGSESAVRSTSDHSSDKIRDIVNGIFDERIRQGQLDECPLTLHDLELARTAFCAVLNGLYHPRIEYPEPSELINFSGTGRVPARNARGGA